MLLYRKILLCPCASIKNIHQFCPYEAETIFTSVDNLFIYYSVVYTYDYECHTTHFAFT